MARVFRTLALALISIAALDAVLWKLEVSRLSPVLIQYSVGPEPGHQEMDVVFSDRGILVWLCLVAIWACSLAGLQGFASKLARLATAAGLFAIQSIVIAVFDPFLLFLILDRRIDSNLLLFLRRWDVLADIYENWGLSRNIHWFIACQIAGILAVLAAAHLSKAKGWKSPAARKVAVLLFATAAWLVSCYAEMLLFEVFYNPSVEAPRLTYVAYAPWSIGGDLYSVVNHAGAALAIAALVGLVIEVAKATLAAKSTYRCYIGALGFQLIVVWATFGHAGLEWAAHFGSLVLSRGTREFYWGEAGIDPVWPWPPMAALVVLGVLALFSWREPPVATEVRPAVFRWVGSWGNLAWLGLAWLVGALARQATDLWFPPSGPWPHLSNVAAFPWNPAGEPQSTTVRLFGALFFALLGLLLVEIVKAMQIRRGRRADYWPLLAFQVVLFCDVFASAAPDWAAYALSSVLGVPVPVEAFPNWPWISLLCLGLLLSSDFLKRRRPQAAVLEN